MGPQRYPDRMDLFALAYYALICAALSAAGPWMVQVWQRIVVGAAVGAIAAMALPFVRALF
jgi:hypothetical protein